VKGTNRVDYLAAGLSLIPLLLHFVANHYIDSPMQDQWKLSPLIQGYIDGTLSFSDYWVQHNVHRILFPKLLMFPLAKLTSWNHGYERIGN
jgi:hypothetical protein